MLNCQQSLHELGLVIQQDLPFALSTMSEMVILIRCPFRASACTSALSEQVERYGQGKLKTRNTRSDNAPLHAVDPPATHVGVLKPLPPANLHRPDSDVVSDVA